MQLTAIFLRLIATSFAALCLSAPANQPPLIVSGMDAVVGQAGWYTSDVTIHTAIFADPEILGPAADIYVYKEGHNEVSIPDGLGGMAMQIVNIDKTAPVVTINDLYLRGDGATILSVTVSDAVSEPVAVQVSLDGGRTWRTDTLPSGFSAPEVTWSLDIDPRQLAGERTTFLARGVDMAGNASEIMTFTGAVK